MSHTICVCSEITESEILEAIASGATTVFSLQVTLKVGTTCGDCVADLMDLIEDFGPV